jgi:hypothetical protein
LCEYRRRLVAGECRQQAERQDQRKAPSHGDGSGLKDRQAERCRLGRKDSGSITDQKLNRCPISGLLERDAG